jgi:hypothetical protein
MAGKFSEKLFADINLDDPFFETLKQDYPGTATSSNFIVWFHKKAAQHDKALVFEDENGIGAFIKLKPGEMEEIPLADGRVLPKKSRLKIGTIKIDERFRGMRIGEGAIGLTLWHWRDLGAEEIYVTTFEKQTLLISQLEKFGFVHVGDNLNGERVYIKNRNYLDFSDPCKAFPFLSSKIEHAGCLAIEMDYHDTMFAYSELAHTIQESVDISVANGLKKIYIGKPYSLSFHEGEPVFIFRKYTGKDGRPGYKSVITSYCIATRIVKVKNRGKALISYDEFEQLVGNKSVYDAYERRTRYENWPDLTAIELLYYGYFGAGNNVNWDWLTKNGCWPGTHPMTLRFNREQFEKILREGRVDVSNVIID